MMKTIRFTLFLTIIYGFRRLEIQHNAFVMLLYCVSATFFYNTVLSLYMYLPVTCVILLILYLSNVWKHYNLYIFNEVSPSLN